MEGTDITELQRENITVFPVDREPPCTGFDGIDYVVVVEDIDTVVNINKIGKVPATIEGDEYVFDIFNENKQVLFSGDNDNLLVNKFTIEQHGYKVEFMWRPNPDPTSIPGTEEWKETRDS